MTTEEVIAIAKTLRPGFVRVCYTPRLEEYGVVFSIQYQRKAYGYEVWGYGNSWEEALRDAGWKGYTPKFVDKYTDCGRPKGSPYEGQD